MCSNVTTSNWFSIKILLLLSLLLNTVILCYGVSLSELYPFGTQYGDKQTPKVDDGGSDKITLKRTFKFFGKNFTILYVSILFFISSLFHFETALHVVNAALGYFNYRFSIRCGNQIKY